MYNVAYLKKIGLKLRNNFCETRNTSLLLWTKNGAHLMAPGLWSLHDGLLSYANLPGQFIVKNVLMKFTSFEEAGLVLFGIPILFQRGN